MAVPSRNAYFVRYFEIPNVYEVLRVKDDPAGRLKWFVVNRKSLLITSKEKIGQGRF
jgi:hypothetical protein